MAANPFASHNAGCNSTGPRIHEPTVEDAVVFGSTSCGRLELRDAEGGGAWTNPLWG